MKSSVITKESLNVWAKSIRKMLLLLLGGFILYILLGKLLEREIIAQSINTGFDVANIQFDLQVMQSKLRFCKSFFSLIARFKMLCMHFLQNMKAGHKPQF